jgi:protein N-terminal amidase
MAWLTREDARSYSRCPKEPDMETLSYWLARMEPLIRAETEGEIICVFANRSGTEDEAVYAGTSAVLGIHSGEVKVYGILGRGEKELLVVDTSKRPQAKLVSEPSSTASDHKNIPIDVRHGENDARKSTIDSSAESSADASTDVRTNSAVSSRSDLSLNTNVTACTIPDFSDACFPKSLEDVITPLSPVDANSPSAFFAPRSRRPEGETFIENLRSSIGQKIQQQHQTPLPDSPTFQQPSPPGSRNASRVRQQEHQESNSPARAGTPAHVRPASPKSRNASRTRMLEYQEPTGPARAGTPAHVRPASPKSRNASRTRMLEYQEPTGPARAGTPAHVRPASPKSRNASRTRTLEYQEPALLYHDLAKVEQRTSSPATVRPSSRNYSSNRHREYQEPAPVSHDPAKEEQIKKRAIGITSPVQPRSAASAPDQSDSAYSPRLTGTRRSSSLSRPRSSIW